MNSTGIPMSRTTPKTDVNHGPRTGLFHRFGETGPSSRPDFIREAHTTEH